MGGNVKREMIQIQRRGDGEEGERREKEDWRQREEEKYVQEMRKERKRNMCVSDMSY